jgi:hypothetical protein
MAKKKDEKISIKDYIIKLEEDLNKHTIIIYKIQGALEVLKELKDKE